MLLRFSLAASCLGTNLRSCIKTTPSGGTETLRAAETSSHLAPTTLLADFDWTWNSSYFPSINSPNNLRHSGTTICSTTFAFPKVFVGPSRRAPVNCIQGTAQILSLSSEKVKCDMASPCPKLFKSASMDCLCTQRTWTRTNVTRFRGRASSDLGLVKTPLCAPSLSSRDAFWLLDESGV
jgi:hypothetical protein